MRLRRLALVPLVGIVGVVVLSVTASSAYAFAPAPVLPVGPISVPAGTAVDLGSVAPATLGAAAGEVTAGEATATILAGSAAAAPETLGLSLAVGAVAAGGIALYAHMGSSFNPDADVSGGYGIWNVTEHWTWGYTPGPLGVNVTNTSGTAAKVHVTVSCNNGATWDSGVLTIAGGASAGTNYACADPVSGDFTATSAAAPHVMNVDPVTGAETNAAADPHPSRTLTATTHCVKLDGSGSSVDVPGTPSASYKEAANSSSPVAGIAPCPAGYGADGLSVDENTVGGGLPDKSVGGSTLPALDSLNQTYPDCVSSLCLLKLFRINGSGQHLDCFANPSTCVDWAYDPNRATDYECDYGTHLLTLQDCVVYLNYWPSTGVATWTDPGTELPPAGSPVPAGGTDPGSGCSIDSSLAGVLTGSVFIDGLKCVLQWAFVPPGGFGQYAGQIKSSFAGTPVGTIAALVPAWFGPILSLGGLGQGDCAGPDLDWSYTINGTSYHLMNHWHPWSACGPVASYVSGVWIPLASFVTYFGAFLICLRIVTSAIGLAEPFTDGAQDLDSVGASESAGYLSRAWHGASQHASYGKSRRPFRGSA